jgi:cell division septal protein FtsQ
VTEHDERLLCAACLERLASARSRKSGRLAWAKRALAGVLGLLLAWLVFYGVGQTLTQMPAEFDEGTAWQRQ